MSATQRTALILFITAFVVYNFPLVYDLVHKPFFTWAPAQDVAPTAVLPVRLLEHGDFFLDEYQPFFLQNWHSNYFVAEVNGKIVTRSTVAGSVLSVPFYGVPLGTGWLRHTGKNWLDFPWSAFFPSKFAASFLTALTVLMFFFCARELVDLKASTTLTVAFAFGTSVWSTAAEGMWVETPSIFFQTIALWFLLRGRHRGAHAVAPAALFFSAATIARPSNALTAGLFTLYILIEYRAAFLRWVLWAIPPVLLAFAYNTVYNGSPFVFGYQDGIAQYMTLPKLDGIIGLFVSPSRGLFVYSPFLILALWGMWHARHEREKTLYLFSALTIAIYCILLSMLTWEGGWGYGTRLMVDVMPFAMLLVIPTFIRLSRLGHIAFGVATGYALVLQSFGLWDYGVRWHWHFDNLVSDMWSVAESEPLFYLKQYTDMAQHYLSVYFFH